MNCQRTLFVQLVFLVLLTCGARAQVLFNEDFDYPVGDSLKMHGWVMTGSASSYSYVNPVSVVDSGLECTGYHGSRVGNAAALASTGQDVSKLLVSPAKEGSVYAFLMVRVSAARSSGDYFFHLIGGPATSSVFAPKLSVKSSDGRLAFGISKRANSSSSTYTGFNYGIDTTYLIVLKYRFVPDASTDDEISLFVFGPSGFPASEPPVPTVGPMTETSGADVDSLCMCGLRQGSSSSAPTVIVDGIRVATTWGDVLPIELSSFHGVLEDAATVTLTWTTQSEIDNYGFEVQRSTNATDGFASVSGLIPGHNTTVEPQAYSFSDHIVTAGRWFYRLKTFSLDQSVSYSMVIEISTLSSIADAGVAPGRFALMQNYPNPFNPVTTIKYTVGVAGDKWQVAGAAGASKTMLVVYDVLGREVATLVNEEKRAGSYEASFDGSNLANGLYIYRLSAGPYVESRKMVLLK